MTQHLLTCPFCGGSAQIDHGQVWGSKAVRVMCSKCHAMTGFITEGVYNSYQGIKNKHFTLEEAEAEAIRKWNTRTERVAA